MPRPDISQNPAFSFRAQVISAISASLSFLSSLLVITFILRSRNKLRGSYHRIMFFMCFWDLTSSLAIAATTLPMPTDVYTVYPFAGPAYGNSTLCEVQAILIFVGLGFTIWSSIVLNLYYVCTIRFGMSEEKFNWTIIPIFLVTVVAFSVIATVNLLSLDLFNPVPSFPYCMVGSYPYDCNIEDDVECIRGAGFEETERRVEISMTTVLSIGFFMVLVSMAAVISSVFKSELAVRNALREFDAAGRGTGESSEGEEYSGRAGAGVSNVNEMEEFIETRMAMRQALMYIAGFILTWGWTGIFLVATRGSRVVVWPILDYLMFIFQPLQGFFNALIFIYSKVWILRRSNRRLSFSQALIVVIVTPKKVPDILLSRLDLVEDRLDDQPVAIELPARPERNNIRISSDLHRANEGVGVNANANVNVTSASVVSDLESDISPGVDASDISEIGKDIKRRTNGGTNQSIGDAHHTNLSLDRDESLSANEWDKTSPSQILASGLSRRVDMDGYGTTFSATTPTSAVCDVGGISKSRIGSNVDPNSMGTPHSVDMSLSNILNSDESFLDFSSPSNNEFHD